MPRHRSSAVPLSWLYGGLIVYASLYPFVGWRVPGVGPFDFLLLGWPRYWTWFDVISNLLGYLPFGFLLFVALIRNGMRSSVAAALACLSPTLLSLTMETLQNYLPRRVSSNVDLALNALGAALGVAIGVALHWHGGIARWQKLRDRWFVARSAGGLALLVLWPVGLLFPTAVPFGLGHVLGRIQPIIVDLLADTPAAAWTEGWTNAAAPNPSSAAVSLSPSVELAIMVVGLLAPCLVAFTIAAQSWRRSLLVLGAVLLGVATMTLSTALNFGPTHAFAWMTQQALVALGVGTAAALLLSLVPRRVAAGFGLIALTALVMLSRRRPLTRISRRAFKVGSRGASSASTVPLNGSAGAGLTPR